MQALLGFAFGMLLAVVGYPITTAQYWLLGSVYVASVAYAQKKKE